MTDFKTYTTKSAAVKSIKKQGLQNVPHVIAGADPWQPIFYVDLTEDLANIRKRGFDCRMINFAHLHLGTTHSIYSIMNAYNLPRAIAQHFVDEAVQDGRLMVSDTDTSVYRVVSSVLREAQPDETGIPHKWCTVGDSRSRHLVEFIDVSDRHLFSMELLFIPRVGERLHKVDGAYEVTRVSHFVGNSQKVKIVIEALM